VSYAGASGSSRAISVGKDAGKDVILARASYEAACILRDAMKLPRESREALVHRRLRKYAPNAAAVFAKERARFETEGRGRNQATYDAMRWIISKSIALRGVEAIQAAVARAVDADRAGLGDDARDIGCGIIGGVTAVGGAILGIYTGGAGSVAVGAGGQIGAQALDCNYKQREAAERIAGIQAASAQRIASEAARQAEAEAQTAGVMASERTKQIRTVAVIGAATVGLLGLGYMIMSA